MARAFSNPSRWRTFVEMSASMLPTSLHASRSRTRNSPDESAEEISREAAQEVRLTRLLRLPSRGARARDAEAEDAEPVFHTTPKKV